MNLNGWISSGYTAVQNWVQLSEDSDRWPPQITKAEFKLLDDDSKEKTRTCSISRVMKRCGDLLAQSLNLISFIRTVPNMSKMQSSCFRRDLFLLKMDLPFFVKIPTFNFANHPSVTEALFKPHRDGALFLTDNGKETIFQLIVDMLGDPTITSEDLIFTCSPEMTSRYRTFLNKAFAPQEVNKHRKVIHTCVEDTLRKWNNMTSIFGSVNINLQSHNFVCDVLCRVLFDREDTSAQMAFSMNTFFNYISSRFLKKEVKSPVEVKKATEFFWSFVDEAIEKKTWITKSLFQSGFNKKQVRMIIFSLFFAGTDSMTSSLTYGILKCAQNRDEQDTVKGEIAQLQEDRPSEEFSILASEIPHVKRILMESLRMFTPVIGILRIAKEDLLLEVTDLTCKGQKVSRNIPKGELIAPSQNLAARCPMLYPDHPEKYDSSRHLGEEEKELSSLPWKPFGGGKSVCPGGYLYQLTTQILFAEMLRNHVLSTNIVGEPQQTGHFINKLEETVDVSFVERK
jgi:cytochrome P450